jgi:alpha-L-fucosidase
MDLYFRSVGRGASFLLNVPPDRRGLVHEADAASLREFGGLLRDTFGRNLAARAKVTSPKTGTPETVIDLQRPQTFNTVRVRENLRLGQRVEAFAVDAWRDGAWREIGAATSIGSCR